MSQFQSSTLTYATYALVWSAAWVDARCFRIPNPVVIAGLCCGLAAHTWANGITGFVHSLAGLGLGLVLLLPLYAIGHGGGGDVKLIAALGAITGAEQLLTALLYSLLAAGALGACYALDAWRREGARGPWERYGRMLRFMFVTGRPSYLPPAPGEAMATRLPMAVPIAIGTSIAIPWPL